MCADCDAARETRGLWYLFDPLCIWCGARLIQWIQRLRDRPREERVARCRVVLTDWVSYGHSERELRELAASGSMPLAPHGERAAQKPTKPR